MPTLTDEENRLAKRALAAMGPWAGGMTAAREHRRFLLDDETAARWDRSQSGSWGVPDMSAPGTQGCLFSRVQTVLGLSEIEAIGHVLDIMVTRPCGYAEALVVALEAGR